MNSVANVLEQSSVYKRFQALAQRPDFPGKLELEARVGKLMQWRSRYRSQYLTETLLQTQVISLTDEQIIAFLDTLKSKVHVPQAVLSRDESALDLQFSADIPAQHFQFLAGIHKVRFNDFVQKSNGISGPIAIRQREDENGRVTERIMKMRLANFDVGTKFDFDYRVSMSLEVPCAEFVVKNQEIRRRASIVFNGVQCDMTETQQGQQVELEALTSDSALGRVIERAREVCAVLSDYCQVYAKEQEEEHHSEAKEASQHDPSDEFD